MASSTAALGDLFGVTGGAYVVFASDGSRHLIDLDEGKVATGSLSGASSPTVAEADSDRLLLVATCRLGEPMVLLLDRGAPGVWFTRRTTASVTRIEQATVSRDGHEGAQ